MSLGSCLNTIHQFGSKSFTFGKMSPIIVEREKSYAVITVLSFIKDNINQGLEAKNIYFRVFLAIKINI